MSINRALDINNGKLLEFSNSNLDLSL
jgi:hypothetical protein